jgi:hypothetical protein
VIPAQWEDADPAPREAVPDVAASSAVDACSGIADTATGVDTDGQRRTLAQKVRAWLGRAA